MLRLAWLCVAIALLVPGGRGAAVSLGKLSGSHAVTLSFVSLDLSAVTLTDAIMLFYRVEGSSIGGQTLFGTGGIASQRFTLSTGLGPVNVQGGASFSSKAFTFGNLVLSANFEGVTVIATGLTANVGSVQTPVYGFGTTVRVSGFVPNLGRLAFVFGIGATPFGQVVPGFCFEGARISWADLGFCGGTAGVDVAFDELGPSAEYLTWTLPLPFCDFQFRAELFYQGLLDFQGFHAGIAGRWGDATVSGDWSFDADGHFVSGSSQVSGQAWGGILVGQATFNEMRLLGVAASWTYSESGLYLTLSPEFEILAIGAGSIEFDTPRLRVDLRHDLRCCEGLSLGQVALGFTVSTTGFEAISVTFSHVF